MPPTTPPAIEPTSRWRRLQERYGVFGALRAHWFGEPEARITEHEPRVPWYVNAMIYATSLAMIFVFGLAEIEAIPHQPPWLAGVLIAMLGLLFTMVYAMDRSLARTIPRIGLLWQRGQYALWLEHLAYAACVGAVEATTYGLVIYTLDANLDSILNGRPLIPPQSRWLLGLVVVRAVVLVWTIAHAYLTHEELPPQWSTGQRHMIELLGGQMVRRIQGLEVGLLPIGKLARAYMLFLQPEPRAAWRWNRRRWRQDQARALLDHREHVVEALEDLDRAIRDAAIEPVGIGLAGDEAVGPLDGAADAPIGIRSGHGVAALASAPSSAGGDGIDWPGGPVDGPRAVGAPRMRAPLPRESGYPDPAPRALVQARGAAATAVAERPASKPMPGTDAYLALVRQARAYLLSVRQRPTVEVVASYLDERPEDIRQAFALIEERDLAARRARSPRGQRQGASVGAGVAGRALPSAGAVAGA
jgi:hypothetical protein